MRALPVALTLMDQALAGAGDAVILIRDREYVCEDRVARRVREDRTGPPADPVNLAGEMRAMG